MLSREFKNNVQYLADEAIGMAFPDGDPIDYIIEKLPAIAKKHGYNARQGFIKAYDDNGRGHVLSVVDILDQIYKGGWNNYLRQIWDQNMKETGLENENPWTESVILKSQIRLEEALEDHENDLIAKVAEILGEDKDKIDSIFKELPIEKTMDVALFADNEEDHPKIETIFRPYLKDDKDDNGDNKKERTPESVAQEIHYLIKENSNYVIIPDIKFLTEMEQREVLAEMNASELQKILANLRGYEYPGSYENGIFTVQMNEEIIRLLKEHKINKLIEMTGLAPGVANRQAAYGSGEGGQPAKKVATGKKTATYRNDQGEDEEGEVVSQDSRNVMVRTKQGVKRMPIASVMVNEDDDVPSKKKKTKVATKDKKRTTVGRDFRADDLPDFMQAPANVQVRPGDFTPTEYDQDSELARNAEVPNARNDVGYNDPDEPEHTTLPAKRSTDVQAGLSIHPDWINVSSLPGYVQQGIRMMARRIFSSYTTANLEEMDILASVLGDTQEQQIRAIASELGSNATELDSFDLDLGGIIPGYSAKGKVYTYGDYDYLFLRDMVPSMGFEGTYIYKWPAKTRVTKESVDLANIIRLSGIKK